MPAARHRKVSARPRGSAPSPAVCGSDARRTGAATRSDAVPDTTPASVHSKRPDCSREEFTTARRSLRIFSLNLASYIETQNQFGKDRFMKNHVQRVIAAVVIVFALQSHAASAQGLLGPVTVPPVPTDILVPAGNTVFLKGSAVGTQNYICQSSATGFFWKFAAPQATLFVNFRVGPYEITQQIATHF